MQIPHRKPGKFSQMKSDPLITEAKFNELKNKLEKLKKATQPQAAEEVRRLAEMGDFSENFAYQMAKGRLRGINQRISILERQLDQAVIILPVKQIDTIKLGHSVTVNRDNKQYNYQILGSAETNPKNGIISYNSPLGSALLGRRVGDTVRVTLANKVVEYKILKII